MLIAMEEFWFDFLHELHINNNSTIGKMLADLECFHDEL